MQEFFYFMKEWNYDLKCVEQKMAALAPYGNSAEDLSPELECSSTEIPDSSAFYPEFKHGHMVQLPDTVIELATYYEHPAYADRAAIFTSQELASLYCKWRSYAVMMQWSTRKNLRSRSKVPMKIQYRLPKSDELEWAIQELAGKDEFQLLQSTVSGKETLKELVEDQVVAIQVNDQGEVKLLRSSYTKPTENIGFRCVCEIIE